MGLHVIIGEDDFLVDEAARRIIGDGSGLEVVDSANSANEETRLRDIREADESFSTPPFLEPRKATWWRHVGFLPGGAVRGSEDAEKVSQAVSDAVAAFAKKLASTPLPENQTFILSGPRLRKDTTVAKTLATVAEMVFFAAESPWNARKAAIERATEFAEANGLELGRAEAEKFVSVVGTDARSAKSEMEKLRAYIEKGRSTVKAEDIDAVTCEGAGVEPMAWALTDAMGERNLAKALSAAARLDTGSGFAVMASTVLERFFRQLAAVKDADSRGMAGSACEGMAPFAVKKTMGFIGNWSLRELRTARHRFLALREKAVSGSSVGSELVAVEMARACRRAPGGGAKR